MIAAYRVLPPCAYESCGRPVKTNPAGRIKSKWCSGHQGQVARGVTLAPLRPRAENGVSMADDKNVRTYGQRIEYLLAKMRHTGMQFPSDARMEVSGWELRLVDLRLEDAEFERQVDRLAEDIARDPEAGRSRRRRRTPQEVR